MPMFHKAYAFDWRAFEGDELPGLLSRSLETGDPSGLVAYIEANRRALKDPYEGDPLGDAWQGLLENRDVHEYCDFALTRFYDPATDRGLGYCWNEIDASLPEDRRQALLGSTLGPEHNRFDPGRYGSYFQTPQQVAESLMLFGMFDLPRLGQHDEVFVEQFEGLLEECIASGLGLYVTF
jgi:hypothetical protein